MSVLEGGGGSVAELKGVPHGRRDDSQSDSRSAEIQKLLSRFKHQRAAMDRTMTALEELVEAGSAVASPRSHKR